MGVGTSIRRQNNMLRYPNLVRNLPAKEAVLHGPWAFESLSQRQYAQVVELEYAPG